ncbi:MAG: neutral/alkaline non-lysosomal ceramidase N-terminal domain-containing protein [Myxococcota bacterium]
MKIESLAAGTCVVGTHRATLTPAEAFAMAGYSWAGRIGTASGTDELYARALYLESNGERVVLCFIDLMSASLRLVQAVAERLRNLGDAELANAFVLAGTHTHTAPGNFYGNSFYDVFAQNLLGAERRGFQPKLVEALAEGIADAIRGAKRNAKPGRLAVNRAEVWGVSRNRSLEAYCANFINGADRITLGGVPSSELTDTQQAIDPRLTTLTAIVDDHVVGVFSLFGCHATALGPKWESYARDWPGVLVDQVEKGLRERGLVNGVGAAVAALGQGAAGDITPLPPDDQRGKSQGSELARKVGEKLAEATLACVTSGLSQAPKGALRLSHESGIFRVEARGDEPRWMIGLAAMGGAEDGRSVFYELGFAREGSSLRPNSSVQSPKVPALGVVQEVLGDVALDIAPYHPWHRLALDSHVLFTVPGEPTVVAAHELEAAVLSATGHKSASVLSYAGDYAGYFTTEPEYECQHYEGAHTLYGRTSLSLYREALLGPAAGIPELECTSDAEQEAISNAAARSLDRLSNEAWRLPSASSCVRLLFGAKTGSEIESATLVIPRKDGVSKRWRGKVRRLPGAGDSRTALFEAEFEFEKLSSDQLPDTGLELEVAGRTLPVRPESALGTNQVLPAQGPPNALLPFVAGALCSLLLAAVLLPMPGLVLDLIGVPTTRAVLLLARMHALGFCLIALNLWSSRNTRDARAIVGMSVGLCWFLALISALAYQSSREPAVLAPLALSAWFGVLAMRAARFTAAQPRVNPEAWRFTPPLEWVGLLTLVGGLVLMWVPGWLLRLLGVSEPATDLLLCLYGANFWLNTCFMWGSRHSRDPKVVWGQLAGSVLMDGVTALMLVFAVGARVVNSVGLVLALPYTAIVVGFLPLLAELRRLQGVLVERPSSEVELQRLVRAARASGRVLRVMGSGHSVARIIYSDGYPERRSERVSSRTGIDVQLDHYASVVFEDLALGRITVQAGMHLGPSPNDPDSLTNNLTSHLRARGLALPDLGGITHQSIAGFVSTGSAGGSLLHAFGEAIVAIRFVDGRGEVHTAYRDRDRELFQAVAVSMGLFGIVSEVTLQCVREYAVQGSETTVALDGTRFELDGRTYTLDGERDGLLDLLKQSEYARVLWWPQPGVQRLSVWRGFRTPPTMKTKALPPVPFQELAGRVLAFFGRVYGAGLSSRLARALRPKLLPSVIKLFQRLGQRNFHDRWDRALPMDNGVDDYWLPTEFTELWLPLEQTPELMRRLSAHYEKYGWDAAGNFSCEIYAAKRLPFWLSPAYARDVVRVDVFWFGRNHGDPARYFAQFWELLAPFGFRGHWAKYLPDAGSRWGQVYIAQQYPKLARFLELREKFDPDQLFVNSYLRGQLGIR